MTSPGTHAPVGDTDRTPLELSHDGGHRLVLVLFVVG